MLVSFLPDFLKEVVTPDLIGGLLFAWGCPVEGHDVLSLFADGTDVELLSPFY